MKITVAGVGYVGLSLGVLLAQHNEVTAVTTTPEKADRINSGVSPIVDKEISEYLAEKSLRLTATVDKEAAYRGAELVVIATPTNYDPVKNYFDTSAVEDVIETVLRVNPEAVMVIKSTIPVGYTDNAIRKYGCRRILFSPEFLREGKALYDNLHPSRIVVGANEDISIGQSLASTMSGTILNENGYLEDFSFSDLCQAWIGVVTSETAVNMPDGASCYMTRLNNEYYAIGDEAYKNGTALGFAGGALAGVSSKKWSRKACSPLQIILVNEKF